MPQPTCYFFSTQGECTNPDCTFRHTNPDAEKKDCPWYKKGFCRHGSKCKGRHDPTKMCENYKQGFCVLGPKCKFAHPKWEMDAAAELRDLLREEVSGADEDKALASTGKVGNDADRRMGALVSVLASFHVTAGFGVLIYDCACLLMSSYPSGQVCHYCGEVCAQGSDLSL